MQINKVGLLDFFLSYMNEKVIFINVRGIGKVIVLDFVRTV